MNEPNIWHLFLFASGLTGIALCLSGFLLIVLVLRGCWCEWAWRGYVKRTAGLPMLKNRHLIGNHQRTLTWAPNSSQRALEAHKELGDTFGWMYGTKPAASTIDLDLIKRVFVCERYVHLNRNKIGVPTRELLGCLTSARGNSWRRIRRSLDPALRMDKLRSPRVIRRVESSVDKLTGLIELHMGSERRASIELDDFVHRFTLDALFGCVFKRDQEVSFDFKPSEWVRLVEESHELELSALFKMAILFPFTQPLFEWFLWYFQPLGVRAGQLAAEFMKSRMVVRQKLKSRKMRHAKARAYDDQDWSLCDPVIDDYLESYKRYMREQECIMSTVSMIGTADTALKTTLVHALYLLATHQESQDKLRESLGAEGLQSKYLEWVLCETLRLLPPAPASCSRTTEREIKLKSSHVIPVCTYVSVSIFALHRCERHWGTDAAEFRPERWADASKFHPYQFLPFGLGAHQCPGKDLALLQMRVALSKLIPRYKFEARLKSDAHEFESPPRHYIRPHAPTYVLVRRIKE